MDGEETCSVHDSFGEESYVAYDFFLTMPLFQCDYCGCAENTALTKCGPDQMRLFNTDTEQIIKYKQQLGLKSDEPFGNYCSACCPRGDETWHNMFDRIYLPKGIFETAPGGNLRHKQTGEGIEKFVLKTDKK